MSVLVVGTVAYDTITTPNTTKKNILGGSGTFFSIACSKFSKVSLIAVVGKILIKMIQISFMKTK